MYGKLQVKLSLEFYNKIIKTTFVLYCHPARPTYFDLHSLKEFVGICYDDE